MADLGPFDPGDLEGVAELDLGRAVRRGYPEAVVRRGYPEAVVCERKTPGQVASIALALKHAHDTGTTTGPVLFTRALGPHAEAVLLVLPDGMHDEVGRILAWPGHACHAAGMRHS